MHAQESRASVHKQKTHTIVNRFEPLTFQVTTVLMWIMQKKKIELDQPQEFSYYFFSITVHQFHEFLYAHFVRHVLIDFDARFLTSKDAAQEWWQNTGIIYYTETVWTTISLTWKM